MLHRSGPRRRFGVNLLHIVKDGLPTSIQYLTPLLQLQLAANIDICCGVPQRFFKVHAHTPYKAVVASTQCAISFLRLVHEIVRRSVATRPSRGPITFADEKVLEPEKLYGLELQQPFRRCFNVAQNNPYSDTHIWVGSRTRCSDSCLESTGILCLHDRHANASCRCVGPACHGKSAPFP